MSVSYFISFIFLMLLYRVSMQSSTKHVEGVEGDTVVLPCVNSLSLHKVYWRYKDIMVVCDINNGAISDVQAAAYKGRVEIFPSEISEGIFSIRLKNVTKEDVGTYTCWAPRRFKLYVQLNVTERPVTRATTVIIIPRNGEPLRRADGLLALLVGFALLYSLAF